MDRNCYIAIPSGEKTDPHGRDVTNFDSVAKELIIPAADRAGIRASRIDEGISGTFIIKDVLSRLLTSDVVVFDITTTNPNILYELGIRHALRPSTTIVIRNVTQRPPFDLKMLATYAYSTDESGHAVPDEAFIEQLAHAIRSGLDSVTSDSPIYEFFPDLEVNHPELNAKTSETLKHLKVAASSAQFEYDSESKINAIRKIEGALKADQGLDPHEYISVIRKYRLESAWDDVIGLAESAPEQVRSSPEVVANLALALNRRNAAGDAERAVYVAERLVAQTGRTGESVGILGRIYRDTSLRYQEAGDLAEAKRFLEKSIETYLDGFNSDPNNIYFGINAASLMWSQPSLKMDGNMRRVLERLRTTIHSSIDEAHDWEDFWVVSTALEVAVMLGNWDTAEEHWRRLRSISVDKWMFQTLAQQLRALADVPERNVDSERIHDLFTRLQQELADVS